MLMWRLCKFSLTPTLRQNNVLLRNILIVGIPKSTVLVIIFRVFIWLLSFKNAKNPFVEFRNVSTRKRTRYSHKESENTGTSSYYSDNEMIPQTNQCQLRRTYEDEM